MTISKLLDIQKKLQTNTYIYDLWCVLHVRPIYEEKYPNNENRIKEIIFILLFSFYFIRATCFFSCHIYYNDASSESIIWFDKRNIRLFFVKRKISGIIVARKSRLMSQRSRMLYYNRDQYRAGNKMYSNIVTRVSQDKFARSLSMTLSCNLYIFNIAEKLETSRDERDVWIKITLSKYDPMPNEMKLE